MRPPDRKGAEPERSVDLGGRRNIEKIERLIAGRNPAMARAIVAEINAGKNVFAAVGALHMAGPKGLPQLLAQQGFKVTRVDFPAPPPVVAK